MAAKEPITAERLRELMTYDPDTGLFRWKAAGGRGPTSHHSGDIVGFVSKDQGYWRAWVDGRLYCGMHRLASLYMTGKWPPKDSIDHHDLDGSNNRWSNLREATKSQNSANRRSNNSSGLKGISWDPKRRRWCARITVRGRTMHLGWFPCKIAAHLAYVVAADKYFGEFARTS